MKKTKLYGIAIHISELQNDEANIIRLATMCSVVATMGGNDEDDSGTMIPDDERGYMIVAFVNKKNRDAVYDGIEQVGMFNDFCKLDCLTIDEKGVYLSEVC